MIPYSSGSGQVGRGGLQGGGGWSPVGSGLGGLPWRGAVIKVVFDLGCSLLAGRRG